MKNNTTSNDTCYTIQPLTTSIDIKTERRLIASWHTSGLSDVQIRKMLMLYFGEPAWMNLQKLYDCNSFSQIAMGLRFRSRQEEHGNRKTCMMTVRKILINYELCIFFKF